MSPVYATSNPQRKLWVCMLLKTSHRACHPWCGSGTLRAMVVPAALAKRQPEGELLRILNGKQPECRMCVRAGCKLERCAISNGL